MTRDDTPKSGLFFSVSASIHTLKQILMFFWGYFLFYPCPHQYILPSGSCSRSQEPVSPGIPPSKDEACFFLTALR